MQMSKYPETLDEAVQSRAYMKGHEERIINALAQTHGIDVKEIPPPTGVLTGVGKISIVYLFAYGSVDELRRYIAKFELYENDRFNKENDAANFVRRVRPLPQILMPIYSDQYDPETGTPGIILYDAVQDFTHTREIAELGNYLSVQLPTNTDNCLNALNYVQDILTNLHSGTPGCRTDVDENARPLEWERSFPFSKKAREGLQSAAKFALPGVDWSRDPERSTELGGRWLPNPLNEFPAMLKKSTGVVKLSMIHGDLNVSNVLMTLGTRQQPRESYLIDISHAAGHEISARDFARIEVDLWANIFPLFTRDNNLQLVQAQISDILNGGEPTIEDPWPKEIKNFLGIVLQWRHDTYKNLNAGPDSLPREYFYALYFSHLKKLSYGRDGAELESLSEAEARKRMAVHVIGAALAKEMIATIETGQLTEQRFRRALNLTCDDKLIASIPLRKNKGLPRDPNNIPVCIQLTDEGVLAGNQSLPDLIAFARQFPGSSIAEERIEIDSPRYAQFVAQKTALLNKQDLDPKEMRSLADLETTIHGMDHHLNMVYAGLQILVFDSEMRDNCYKLRDVSIAANAIQNFVNILRCKPSSEPGRKDRRLIYPSIGGSGYHLYLTDDEFEEWARDGWKVEKFNLTAKAEWIIPALLAGMLSEHDEITERDLSLLHDVDAWTIHES